MVFKANVLPPKPVRIYYESFKDYDAADHARDTFLFDYDEHRPHTVIVKWGDEYYVVYGKENYKGFMEYQE